MVVFRGGAAVDADFTGEDTGLRASRRTIGGANLAAAIDAYPRAGNGATGRVAAEMICAGIAASFTFCTRTDFRIGANVA